MPKVRHAEWKVKYEGLLNSFSRLCKSIGGEPDVFANIQPDTGRRIINLNCYEGKKFKIDFAKQLGKMISDYAEKEKKPFYITGIVNGNSPIGVEFEVERTPTGEMTGYADFWTDLPRVPPIEISDISRPARCEIHENPGWKFTRLHCLNEIEWNEGDILRTFAIFSDVLKKVLKS